MSATSELATNVVVDDDEEEETEKEKEEEEGAQQQQQQQHNRERQAPVIDDAPIPGSFADRVARHKELAVNRNQVRCCMQSDGDRGGRGGAGIEAAVGDVVRGAGCCCCRTGSVLAGGQVAGGHGHRIRRRRQRRFDLQERQAQGQESRAVGTSADG